MDPPDPERTPDAAVAALIRGNARYASGRLAHPHQTPADRRALTQRHRPVAVVVSCSDARVPPDLIFDQGLGDLFAVRIAGHVVGDDALASVRYAVQRLDTPAVVVVGHRSCGAVGLALDAVRSGGATDGPLLRDIAPAVREALAAAPDGDRAALHDAAVALHAAATARTLANDPALRPALAAGRLTVRSGVYDLAEGGVTGLEQAVRPDDA